MGGPFRPTTNIDLEVSREIAVVCRLPDLH